MFETRGVIGPNGGNAVSEQCPSYSHFAICIVERAVDPPKIVRIDLENGTQQDLFDPNVELRKRLPKSAVHIAWPDVRGLHHSGVLISARARTDSERPPLVITSYLCLGFLRGGTGATVPEFILAEHGFTVLCTNADEDLTAPSYASGNIPAGQATRLQYMLDGWESAVRFLDKKQLIDSRRVGISGLSFTGEAVNYAITHSHFAAAATSGHMTITDAINYYVMAGYGKVGLAEIKGYGLLDPRTEAGSTYYQTVSAAQNAGQVTAPLLVQTDEAEFHWGLQYYGALRLERKPAEIVVFPNEAHLFWQPLHRLVMNERNIDWFRFWLQQQTDPSAGKRDQYARWRQLSGVQ
jgi:dipeptidyl aminopeptidase/acylaminoacyl peptidase